MALRQTRSSGPRLGCALLSGGEPRGAPRVSVWNPPQPREPRKAIEKVHRQMLTHQPYEFVIGLDVEDITPELENRVLAAGCDDGLLCKANGQVFLSFERESESQLEAMRSAIADLKRVAVPLKQTRSSVVTRATTSRSFALHLAGTVHRLSA